MSQISKPMQIALAAVVVFAIAWFLVLRPSDDAESTAETQTTTQQAPGVTGLTNAVKKAKKAEAVSEARNTQAEQATGEQTTPTTATGSSTTSTTADSGSSSKSVTPAGPAIKDPARSSGDPADGVLDQLKGQRVAILLFTGNGADDRAAIRAVRAVGREDGKTIVRVTSMRNVGKYATITDKLGINQAPSTVIIGSDMVAQVLTGIIDTKVVKQYVGDARRRAAKAD